MIRRFCDCCGTEVSDTNPGLRGIEHVASVRFGKKPHDFANVQINIKATVRGKLWYDADLCKYCIINAVNSLDDRPKPDCGGGCAAHD